MADPQTMANRVAEYVRANELWFGTRPRSAHRPLSWALAMEPLYLPSPTYSQLIDDIPNQIGEFVSRAGGNLLSATEPVCVRPDFVVNGEGRAIVIECNVDRRLDRGIAHGVEEYTVAAGIGPPSELCGIADAYSHLLKSTAAQEPRLRIYLPASRVNYFAQEQVFTRALTRSGIPAEVLCDAGEPLPTSSYGGFMLPELETEPERWENDLAYLASNWTLIGKPVGLDDKRHFVGLCGKLRDFVETFDLTEDSLHASPWRNLQGLAKANPPAVLKRAGVGPDSTESISVVVSRDETAADWAKWIRSAACSPSEWVVQPWVDGQRAPIEYRLTPRGKTRSALAHYRLTGFYVRTAFGGSEFALVQLTATLGTDREMLRGMTHVIRARRECTYAVVRRE